MITSPYQIEFRPELTFTTLCEIKAACCGQRQCLSVSQANFSKATAGPFYWNGEELKLVCATTVHHRQDGSWTELSTDILNWFAEEYPSSFLISRYVQWQDIDLTRIQWNWWTDNEQAGLMMRMRWS
jgi:hypothetical protein